RTQRTASAPLSRPPGRVRRSLRPNAANPPWSSYRSPNMSAYGAVAISPADKRPADDTIAALRSGQRLACAGGRLVSFGKHTKRCNIRLLDLMKIAAHTRLLQ